MKRPARFLAWILLSLTAGYAQQNTPPAAGPMTSTHSLCPVGIEAEHGVGGSALAIDRNWQQAAQDGQMLMVTVKNDKRLGIAGLKFTAHGVTAKAHVEQLGAAHSAEIARTLDVSLKVNGQADASTGLVLESFTAVRYLDLEAVRYADGSAWQASNSGDCRVYPNPLMLIGER